MSHQINGWKCSPRTDVVLSTGKNNNLVANEHMVLYPAAAGCIVTGFIPPDEPSPTMAWEMTVSNGGVDDILFTNDDAGSDAGQRTLMPPGMTQYTLSLGQTVTFACVLNSDYPQFTGWYPEVAGVLS